jgi:CDP-glucose 4,6-dehydratase
MIGMIKMLDGVFKGKTVLVTGHTGFKGSWLSIWLRELGAKVIGYALPPYTKDDNFVVTDLCEKIDSNIDDIRDFDALKYVFDGYQPEIVFHLAAQPLVRLSYKEPKLTYATNIMGTVNLLECCRLSDSVKVIINVTSDKCYENKEWIWGYRETDSLGGHDPYSSSKACSELITSAYRDSFFGEPTRLISTVRVGNVIGGGDWREDRIVPDCIRALKNNNAIGIRNPQSIRPWQYVLEPLYGYLLLASKMWRGGQKYVGAWNFAPNKDSIITVEELAKQIIAFWGKGKYKDLSGLQEDSPKETNVLTLDNSKVMNLLGWKPKLSIDEAIEQTILWYKTPKVDYEFCVKQIEDYVNKEQLK